MPSQRTRRDNAKFNAILVKHDLVGKIKDLLGYQDDMYDYYYPESEIEPDIEERLQRVEEWVYQQDDNAFFTKDDLAKTVGIKTRKGRYQMNRFCEELKGIEFKGSSPEGYVRRISNDDPKPPVTTSEAAD